jgi:predicted permease
VPGWLNRFLLRARATLSPRHDRELHDELELHLRLLEEDYAAQGLAPDAARQRARREFGNPAIIHEASHDLFSFRLLEDLVQDLRYAAREMRRSAGFTMVAVLSLAIGVGAITATFAMVDAVMLRQLPVREPGRLVAFSRGSATEWGDWSYGAFVRWRGGTDGLDVAASSEVRPIEIAVTGGDRPEEARVSAVSDSYFEIVGANLTLGRSLAGVDPTAPAVAVISDAFWRRQFGGAADVLTKTIELRGTQYAVVGVARRGFTGHSVGYPTDVWIPLAMQPSIAGNQQLLDDRPGADARWLKVLARLKADAVVERAELSAQVVRDRFLGEKSAHLGSLSPEVQRDRQERVRLVAAATGDAAIRGRFARPLRLLTGITALVLLVACANFTNLMVARSEGRRREYGIRLALGGGRWRLIRQAATECIVLAVTAGLLGALLATWLTMGSLNQLAAMILPVDFALEMNTRVWAFAAGCVAVAIAFGIWPCTRPARASAATLVPRSWTSSAQSSARAVAGRAILIAQLTMCVVLLIGAGLLLRTVVNLRSQDLGFDRNVLIVPVPLARAGHSEPAAAAIAGEIRARVAALPGVQAAGLSGSALMDYTNYWIDGSQRLTTDRGAAPAGVRWTVASVGQGFFETVGMSLVRGRTFDAIDAEGSAAVVVLNESLAGFLFGRDDPIGKQISMSPRGPAHTIVGLVNDAHQISPRDRGIGVLYLPMRSFGHVLLAVRTEGPPSSVAAAVRQQIGEAAGGVQAGNMRTISNVLDTAIGQERLLSVVAMSLAGLVVAIGCVGLYALLSYNVARRSHEIGVRFALGATHGQIVAIVLRDGAASILPALALGIPVGIAASRPLSSQLYGVEAGDPWTLVSVGVLLPLVALAAAARPARAASRIDPIMLLRNE